MHIDREILNISLREEESATKYATTPVNVPYSSTLILFGSTSPKLRFKG